MGLDGEMLSIKKHSSSSVRSDWLKHSDGWDNMRQIVDLLVGDHSLVLSQSIERLGRGLNFCNVDLVHHV